LNPEFEAYTQPYKDRIVQRMLETVAETHPETLYDPMRYAVQAGGKLLRPILALLCGQAVGGTVEAALPAAVALELVHNFSLVHDDIMDNDELRRGRETVHKKWDANVAILSGDALLIKADEALSEVNAAQLPRVLKAFNQGILEVCEGQTLDMEFEARHDVSLDEYFYMIDRKTAKLFSLSCELGAILGGGSEEQIQAMRTYGMDLGRAFQVQDDLLDVLSDVDTLGKDVGSDIQADKKTFLMLYMREHANAQQVQRIQSIQRKQHVSTQDIQDVIAILTEVGSIEAARKRVTVALNDARESLRVVTNTTPQTLLSTLLDMLEDRTY